MLSNRIMNTRTKTFSMFFLATLMVAVTLSMTIPKSSADSEYRGYEQPYAKDRYYHQEYNIYDDLSKKNHHKNGLNINNLYIVEGPAVSTQGSEFTESIASCEPGDFVISGGFNFFPENIPNNIPLSSNPTDTLDGWSASFENGIPGVTIQATAVCFNTS